MEETTIARKEVDIVEYMQLIRCRVDKSSTMLLSQQAFVVQPGYLALWS